jgi:dTDP-4-dehydrorhamnose 3,5-epimerase-like enzyme
MNLNSETRWNGLRDSAKARIETRDYSKAGLAERLMTSGVGGGELISGCAELADAWIPGIEIFQRRVYQQKGRGYFSEFTRLNEGVLHEIGLAPQQWASALMHRDSAKGFHIHPPFIPEGEDPAKWFQSLFIDSPKDYSRRLYQKEQWDVMFFIRGICEMFLIDERAGMPRRKMRIFIEGDQMPGPNNAGLVIPPGVAHALRGASSEDLIMVYGTSTTFDPEFEGRIRSGVEQAFPPDDWQAWWDGR